MKEFDHAGGRIVDDRVVDIRANDYAGQRNGRVGHTFGKRDHVGNHAEGFGGKRVSGTPKAGNDFVKNQQ